MKKLSAFLVAVVTGGLFLSAQATESSLLEATVRPTMEPEVFYIETIARPTVPEVFFVETVARVEIEPAIVVVIETTPRAVVQPNISLVEMMIRSPI